MATPRLKWPQNCEWARMDSISLAEQGWRMLDALLDELDNAHQVRQVGRVMDNLKEIRFKLTVCRDGKNETKETQP
jgi:hypothetical protein